MVARATENTSRAFTAGWRCGAAVVIVVDVPRATLSWTSGTAPCASSVLLQFCAKPLVANTVSRAPRRTFRALNAVRLHSVFILIVSVELRVVLYSVALGTSLEFSVFAQGGDARFPFKPGSAREPLVVLVAQPSGTRGFVAVGHLADRTWNQLRSPSSLVVTFAVPLTDCRRLTLKPLARLVRPDFLTGAARVAHSVVVKSAKIFASDRLRAALFGTLSVAVTQFLHIGSLPQTNLRRSGPFRGRAWPRTIAPKRARHTARRRWSRQGHSEASAQCSLLQVYTPVSRPRGGDGSGSDWR
jgi:hypothetical protein